MVHYYEKETTSTALPSLSSQSKPVTNQKLKALTPVTALSNSTDTPSFPDATPMKRVKKYKQVPTNEGNLLLVPYYDYVPDEEAILAKQKEQEELAQLQLEQEEEERRLEEARKRREAKAKAAKEAMLKVKEMVSQRLHEFVSWPSSKGSSANKPVPRPPPFPPPPFFAKQVK